MSVFLVVGTLFVLFILIKQWKNEAASLVYLHSGDRYFLVWLMWFFHCKLFVFFFSFLFFRQVKYKVKTHALLYVSIKYAHNSKSKKKHKIHPTFNVNLFSAWLYSQLTFFFAINYVFFWLSFSIFAFLLPNR